MVYLLDVIQSTLSSADTHLATLDISHYLEMSNGVGMEVKVGFLHEDNKVCAKETFQCTMRLN